MIGFLKLRFSAFFFMTAFAMNIYANNETAPKAWSSPLVLKEISENILYFPIAHESVKSIPIEENNENLVDLIQINDSRIKPLSDFNEKYKNSRHVQL